MSNQQPMIIRGYAHGEPVQIKASSEFEALAKIRRSVVTNYWLAWEVVDLDGNILLTKNAVDLVRQQAFEAVKLGLDPNETIN